MKPDQIIEIVSNPSLGAVTYQAHRLIDEIKNLQITDQPSELRHVRNLLLCIATRIQSRLWELYDPEKPYGAKGTAGFEQTRSLGRALRNVHSFVRYICSDRFRKNPQSLHFIMNALASRHMPLEYGTPICIVRTKWNYGSECEPLSARILTLFSQGDFSDDSADSGLELSVEMIKRWWNEWCKELSPDDRSQLQPEHDPPLQVAVLSFPGLDSHDAFLFPLLGHELGHFLDSSSEESLTSTIVDSMAVDESLEDRLKSEFTDMFSGAPESLHEICVRELLADVLAVRMIGLSYFISLAEYLKTIYSWDQPLIDIETGYPGITLRLWVVLRHITSLESGFNYNEFITSARTAESHIGRFLNDYIEQWSAFLTDNLRDYLDHPEHPVLGTTSDETEESTITIIVKLALDAKEHIFAVASKAVTKPNAPSLSIFQRIRLLEDDKPPLLPSDNVTSFGEIIAATWLYEFLYGEPKEIEHETLDSQYDAYDRTCKKVLEAMDLLRAQTLSNAV